MTNYARANVQTPYIITSTSIQNDKERQKKNRRWSEPAKGPAVKDGGEDNSSAMADASRIHAKEVFGTLQNIML